MLRLEGLVSDPEGRSVFRDSVVGSAAGADALGETLAETLLGRGADRVLAALKEKR
jgi:hydroxymethylbilane synthase